MDEVRTGAPVGQTPPTPPAPPPGPTPTAAKGAPLQLPAPQGGAINVVTDQMAWRLAKLNALATMREFARLGMKVEWNAERPDILERARAAADELYGSIIQTAGQRVKDYFAQQLAEGKAPPDVAKALSEQFRGVSGRQARMVARTVTRQLYNEAALDAYEAAGVREVTASDGHGGLTGKSDAACRSRNGRTFTIDEARAEEHSPTTHPNAVLAGTHLIPVGRPQVGYSAAWAGPVIEFRGRSGVGLTVTPNHPVLTGRGWIAAKFLKPGDQLVRCTSEQVNTAGIEDLKHVPTRVEEIVDALRADGSVVSSPAVPDHLHGDGNFCEGEVEVVRADRSLTGIPHLARGEHDGEGILNPAFSALKPITPARCTDTLIESRAPSAGGGVRGGGGGGIVPAFANRYAAYLELPSDGRVGDADLCAELRERLALLVPARESVPVGASGGATGRSDGGTGTLEVPTERGPAEPGFAAESGQRFPIVVTLDEIVEVRRGWHEGLVYDIQTEGGVYLAESYMISNCTLSWRPVVPDEGLRSEDSVMNAALPANGHRHLLLVWEAEKHPRWPKGTPRVGGEWMDTESVVDLVRMGAPGVRDLSFLARGAQRIRSIHGAERGDGVDLHVELGDGSSHVLHVPRATHWSTVQRAISAVDAAPSSSGTPSAAGERTVEKTLADIAAGERFRLVTDPTSLYQTFERVTPGESKRGDGRITVRNVDTGKRVHMAPDRRIDHFTREKPLTRMRVADLKPGDRFFVGDRQYELLPQGGSKRKDGRITGREVATGKRVHFKPDREVERRRGPAKPPAPPPPPKPPKPPPRVRKPPAPPPPPPDPELPDGYAALPNRGEAYPAYTERFPGRLPGGYEFVSIPAHQWHNPKVKSFTAPPGQYGASRLYGKTGPIDTPGSDFVVVLVERQRGREVPWMRGFTHSYASVSRKNVVAAWSGPDREQVFYRPPELPDATPKDVKLIKGKRFPLIQIPGGNAHFVIRKGERYQVDQHLPNGETILWPLTAKGDPRRDAPQRVDSMERVTYGLPEQKPVPEELIRSREPLTAQRAAKGELVQLDDGLYYRVTGVKRKGANVGVEMKLANVAGAPVTRVPLDSEVHVVKLVGRDGAVTHAMSLQAGDTFRTTYGRFTVTSVERSDKGVLSIKAQHEDGGAIRSFSAYSRVQLGSEAPTPQGNYFLWQIAEPGGHVQRGIHGYEVIGPERQGGNTWYAYDVATGKRARLYTYEPEYKPGLPPGEQPLPPKVEIPGRRLRDMRHPDSGGKPFTYRGESYIRLGRPGVAELHGQPRGTVPVKLNAPGSSVRFLPDSALVVPEGESHPYGPPGPARRAALLAKAREVYRSRRGPQSEDEYRDVGALVHEAMLEAAPGAPGNTAMAAHERGELRAALTEIRTLARGTTSTFRGAGLEQISDHDNNPASVRDPDAVERAEFMQAERWFPESWMEQVEDDGGTKIAVGVWRGFYRHGFVASQPEARLIAVSDSKPQVIQHEMGHRVENALPTIQTLCTEFWQRRTSGDPTTKLYQGRDEVTKEDHFASKYMGKVYGMRGGGEIFSMGIEDLVHPYSRYPDDQLRRVGKYSLLHQDADYAHFMLGLLAALKTDAEVAQIMEEERRLSGE